VVDSSTALKVGYSATLRRSLIDRAQALGSYIGSLQARSARTDEGFSIALDMCHRYTNLIERQVNEDWERTSNAHDRHKILLGLVREFVEKEQWIDRQFARGAHGGVPRALKTIARREFRSHGLNDYEPVLTVGPPDNFETHKSNLSDYLFGNLYTVRAQQDLADLPVGRRLSIISVPYIAGTRALWHPITIGHEIAHIRIEEERASHKHLKVEIDLDPGMEAYGGDDSSRPTSSGSAVVQVPLRTLQNWVDEILCDLNAVRLFGPAGLSAIAEFLSIVMSRPDGPGPESPSRTHPPLSVRLDVMFRFLETVGEKKLPAHVEPWRDYLQINKVTLLPEANVARLIEHVLGWGETYSGKKRATEIDWLEGELLDGIPGGTHCLHADRAGSELTIGDVVNAAWMARSAFDDAAAPPPPPEPPPPPIDSQRAPALFRSKLTSHEKRLRVDSLASKAIDSIEFALRWSSTGGSVTNLGAMKAPRVTDERGGGILSRALIIDRLKAAGPTRLVVTPLLADSVQDAGIDLRLGPDFIVFRHSATAAFDALNMGQDPRMLQEAVEKAWGVPFILHPGELVLASTLEYIVVPEDVAAHVVTRSSYGRLGLITATAVQVQPGSYGCITLELVNHGETPIALTPGARVAGLVFFNVAGSREIEPGKYRFPVGPEFSKVQMDTDREALAIIARDARTDLRRVKRVGQTDRDRLVKFRFTSTHSEATWLQEIAESEGAQVSVTQILAELGDASPSERVASLVGSEALAQYVLVGAAAAHVFGSVIVRLVRALSRGALIEVSEGGTTVTAPPDMPRGLVVVSARDKTRTEVVLPSTGGATEVLNVLTRAISQQRPPLPPE